MARTEPEVDASSPDASTRKVYPARVQPKTRKTFGALQVTPAGTEFHLLVVSKIDTTDFMLALCGEPCSTATLVKYWYSEEYASGDELSWRVSAAGRYYLWAPDRNRNDAPVAVADELLGDKLRITFDTGCIVDAWYVIP